ncbi:SDR family oxidoreductase [uncultured Thiodictyon sp.]|uniref:SDR family oxidoreductase n=1 Tax=uncultured Thiodictyon sp. TaxID=1846217 RepID=UPI0025F16776|nr:SDR family oxidoreductase [uncultured Thiodictyon sp.]
MKRASSVLVLGATSAIAEHLARHLAARGASLYLTGRSGERLTVIAADLRIRGAAEVAIEQLDVIDRPALNGIVARAAQALGSLDTVLFAAGLLPDQTQVETDPALLRLTLEVNAISAMVVLNAAAAYFERQGHGQLVAIGSVAGDRGRAANDAYGAAKGALEIFMSGLRQRLHKSGVQVLLVKPGFVDTPMTAGFAKGPLWASPERVAQDIVRAMDRGRSVIYTPWFWRGIMLIIRHLPERLFVRLRF